MSKIKLLLSVVEDMRSLADSIQALCEASEENEPTDTIKKAEKPKTKAKPNVTLDTVKVLRK